MHLYTVGRASALVSMALLLQCTRSPAPGPLDSGPSQDAGATDASPDAGEAPSKDSGADLGPEDLGNTDLSADSGPADLGSLDVGAAPVDCTPAQATPGWTVCEQSSFSCEIKFTEGSGCQAVCASLGLPCAQIYEDLDGECAPDLNRPALGCADATGHQSDYCVCAQSSCQPQCQGKVCGSDGCGGSCGRCGGATPFCNAGAYESAQQEDCSRYPFRADTLLSERAGFGANATGGDPTNLYRVTTLAGDGAGSLRAGLESNTSYWIVFDVNGTITHNTPVRIRPNKTVDGRGRSIAIEGTLLIDEARNIIISDVEVTNPLEGFCTQAGDVIRAQGNGDTPSSYTTRDLWLHHIYAHTGGDGLIDLRGASMVTLSWSHLRNHKKGMLMAQNKDGQPSAGMRVTMHHNYFDRLSLRGPQFLYGWAHYYNNYQFEWYEYGAASLDGAQFYSENNIFQARPNNVCVPSCPDPNPCGDNDFVVSKEALVNAWSSNGQGNVLSTGDLLLNDAEVQPRNPQQVFDPSSQYAYTAQPATEALAAQIAASAGPRTDYCQAP